MLNLSPGIPKLKVLWWEKRFFQISEHLPKLEIIESPISNIFADDLFSKLFLSGLPIPEVRIKCDVSIKSWSF